MNDGVMTASPGLCARYHHVSISDVRRSRSREQRANGLSMQSVKRDHVGFIMLDHPPQAHMPGQIPSDLR